MKFKLSIAVPIIIFLVLYIFLIGYRPLIMPDEARYVEIPREMLADHDFVTPRLNGLRYFEKPFMGYWLIAGAIRVFGENAFAGRFMPAVSTGLAALIVLLLATKMTGKRELGGYAAGCFLLMPLVFIIGTTCTLDSIFSLFITATIASFYCAMEEYLKKKPTEDEFRLFVMKEWEEDLQNGGYKEGHQQITALITQACVLLGYGDRDSAAAHLLLARRVYDNYQANFTEDRVKIPPFDVMKRDITKNIMANFPELAERLKAELETQDVPSSPVPAADSPVK